MERLSWDYFRKITNAIIFERLYVNWRAGFKKARVFFLKSPTQWVFWVLLGFGVLLGFFGQAGKNR